MDANVGTADRRIRIIIGLFLVSVPFSGFLGDDWVSELLTGISVIAGLLLTISGVLARCFVYKVLGIDTCNAS